MTRERAEVTKDDKGTETHPAFGVARIGRISSNPGEVLFQSDLRHREYIELTVSEATRERDLKDDWVFPGRTVCRVMMSMAQFASMVASGGTEGVPVTIEYTDKGPRPGLYPQPRLAETTGEVRQAAQEAFKDIQASFAELQAALDSKAPAAVRKRAMSNLQSAIRNAVPNVEFAGKRLEEHAEAVVEKSRADVNATVAAAYRAQAPELSGQDFSPVLAIEEGG